MTLHEFTVFLDRQPTDDDLDRLFEVGLDDSQPEYGAGQSMLHVSRDAPSLTDALVSVKRNVTAAGMQVVGVEDEDLVTLQTIAQRLDRSYESLRLIAAGKRGPGGFPAPITAGQWSLYSWTEVTRWFRSHGTNLPQADRRAQTLAAANHLLRAKSIATDDLPHLTELIAA